MSTPFRGMLGMLTAAFVAVVLASPAAAHTELISSDPQDGQTLTAAPERLTLRFGEDVLSGGAQIVAKDQDGGSVDVGPVNVDGPRITADWPQSAAAGSYTVAWRAVADDGHPLEGTFTFDVAAADASPAAATPSASPVAATTDEQEAGQGVNLVLPALFVLALAAVGFFVWRSRGD